MKHVTARAIEDVFDSITIHVAGLPIIRAGERVLALGKQVTPDRIYLIVTRHDPAMPNAIICPEKHFEFEAEPTWQEYTAMEQGAMRLYATPDMQGGVLAEWLIPDDSNDQGGGRATWQARERLDAVIRQNIEDLLKHTTGSQYTFVPYDYYTLERFPDPILSIKLDKFQSFNRFDEHATNYLIDCREMETVKKLRAELSSLFFSDANDLFRNFSVHNEYKMTHNGKVLSKPIVYFYFIHTEEFLRSEKDKLAAVKSILVSMVQCSKKWPGDIEFIRDEGEKYIKFVFYYLEKKNEMVQFINNYLGEKGLRVLDKLS